MRLLTVGFSLLLGISSAWAADAAPINITVKVANYDRVFTVYAPEQAERTPSPLIFCFHGHGGTAKNAANSFQLQKHWPEAIVVYMQGVLTPSPRDPDGKRTGWQHNAGDHDDRDLKFFDETLKRLKTIYQVDDKRIYTTGHSNGGAFTVLLWATRGDVFAAVAPSSASSAVRFRNELKPKPAFHVAGEKDTIVPFDGQQKVIELLRKLNGCDDKGKSFGKHSTIYQSKTGTPFVAFVHPGDHKFPDEAPEQMVRFFKENPKK